MKKWHKNTFVILGAVILSTVAIQASDMVRNIDSNLARVVREDAVLCREGSVYVALSSGALCVDAYEASPASVCPVQTVVSARQTQDNLNAYECVSQSVPDAMPWRFVSQQQAQQLCARSGKRLLGNDEWFAIASAIGDESSCVKTGEGPQRTGMSECITYAGVHDVVGNVWEWIDAQVSEGVYEDRNVPKTGYVQEADVNGIVLTTSSVGSEEYGYDYAHTNQAGVYGVVRGGFYGSGDDAGIYAQNLSVDFSTKAPGIGFRCVSDI